MSPRGDARTWLIEQRRVELRGGFHLVDRHDHAVESHHGHAADSNAAFWSSQEGTFRAPSRHTCGRTWRHSPGTSGVPVVYGDRSYRWSLEADALPAPVRSPAWLRRVAAFDAGCISQGAATA